jgi:hypothetical protein
MNYTVIGVLGFLVSCLFDMFSLKRVPRAKQGVGIVAIALIVYATLIVCLRYERLGISVGLIWLGWAILYVSDLLLIYSLFISLPFRKTYVTSGAGHELIRTNKDKDICPGAPPQGDLVYLVANLPHSRFPVKFAIERFTHMVFDGCLKCNHPRQISLWQDVCRL